MTEATGDPGAENRPAVPRLLAGSTVIEDGLVIHLIAGEDFRFTIQAGESTTVVARLLRQCRGDRPWSELTAGLLPHEVELATRVVQRLLSERVVFDGPALPAPGKPWQIEIEGAGSLAEMARTTWQASLSPTLSPGPATSGPSGARERPPALVRVLVQQDLDYARVLEFNRRQLAGAADAWLWVTTGPLARGYVTPVILPRGRPCLECLLRHFRRLSPAPQLYDALSRTGPAGGEFVAADPDPALARILLEIAHWKLQRLKHEPALSAQYALHVVEAENLETAVHPVWLDPTCPECGDG
ncbi:MAG TPA: hypothetical protein DDY91_07565 [Planctomycetaceae bacterium]|nr:hypothetical protein [Planctomycetaceae bacterium]